MVNSKKKKKTRVKEKENAKANVIKVDYMHKEVDYMRVVEEYMRGVVGQTKVVYYEEQDVGKNAQE